jgi:hypothetical protein
MGLESPPARLVKESALCHQGRPRRLGEGVEASGTDRAAPALGLNVQGDRPGHLGAEDGAQQPAAYLFVVVIVLIESEPLGSLEFGHQVTDDVQQGRSDQLVRCAVGPGRRCALERVGHHGGALPGGGLSIRHHEAEEVCHRRRRAGVPEAIRSEALSAFGGRARWWPAALLPAGTSAGGSFGERSASYHRTRLGPTAPVMPGARVVTEMVREPHRHVDARSSCVSPPSGTGTRATTGQRPGHGRHSGGG